MELRYLKRPSQQQGKAADVALQYRERDLNDEYRFVWTEWKDVPTVVEYAAHPG